MVTVAGVKSSGRRGSVGASLVAPERLSIHRSGGRDVLRDGSARVVRYVRLSVTDRCNLRCRYCMPTGGVTFQPRADVLTYEEIVRLVRLLVANGVTHVRLTGGEPLLRRDLVSLVERLAAIEGLVDLSLSTNGHGLASSSSALRAAGLRRVNVSLDTLDPARFRRMTGTDGLARVLAGIDAAQRAGFSSVKLNTVGIAGFNDDELVNLARFAGARGLIPRFIEFMPVGVDDYWSGATFMGLAEMRAALATAFAFESDEEGPTHDRGPARYGTLWPLGGGAPVQVGFISALSDGFCGTCNRIRITATGTLQACLAYPGGLSLRDAMRGGIDDDALRGLIQGVLGGKGPGHAFRPDGGGERARQTMSVTGG